MVPIFPSQSPRNLCSSVWQAVWLWQPPRSPHRVYREYLLRHSSAPCLGVRVSFSLKRQDSPQGAVPSGPQQVSILHAWTIMAARGGLGPSRGGLGPSRGGLGPAWVPGACSRLGHFTPGPRVPSLPPRPHRRESVPAWSLKPEPCTLLPPSGTLEQTSC